MRLYGKRAFRAWISLAFISRVKDIAEGVAPKVEDDDGDEDGETREEHQPWSCLELLTAFIQHEAPFRSRRLAAEAEEGEAGKLHHHGADISSRGDDHERENIWKDVDPEDMH